MNVETFNYSPESLAPFFYLNKRDRKNIYIFSTEKEALDAKENKSKLLENTSLPKENEVSKLLRYFVVPFLLTVVVVGYSLLRVLNYPKKAVSPPGLPRQGGIQAKDTFTQNEIRKSQKKKKLKLSQWDFIQRS